jgi:hypothetical protein
VGQSRETGVKFCFVNEIEKFKGAF